MSYKEGITINGVHSYADKGLCIASRQIDLPPKKSIRKTIPYMNGYYDFSLLGGASVWDARTITYTFDIIGETIEEMDRKRTGIVNWLCNVHDVDIYDDTIPDYHFHGSFDTASQSEDGEKSELTVSFICYPFMIINEPTVLYTNGDSVTLMITNNGQPVKPIIDTVQDCVVTIGTSAWSVNVGRSQIPSVLPNGKTEVKITKENQIIPPYQGRTHAENGINFLVQSDGSILVNGTATEVAWFYIRGSAEVFKPNVGYHVLMGCPVGGGGNTYRMQVYVSNGEDDPVYFYDNGDGGIVEITEKAEYISMAIRISKGYTADNLVFVPQLYGETIFEWRTEVL